MMNGVVRACLRELVTDFQRNTMSATSKADSSDASSWKLVSTSHGNGRNSTFTTRCGKWIGFIELPPLSNFELPCDVLSVCLFNSFWIDVTEKSCNPSEFAPWLTVNATKSAITRMPIGRDSRIPVL